MKDLTKCEITTKVSKQQISAEYRILSFGFSELVIELSTNFTDSVVSLAPRTCPTTTYNFCLLSRGAEKTLSYVFFTVGLLMQHKLGRFLTALP